MKRDEVTRSLFFIIMAWLLAIPAVSQDVRQQGESKFALKTTTQVVLVNVQVKDGKGNFIRDLKQDDFTISEDGKAQKIVSMDIQNTDALTQNGGELQALNLLGDLDAASSTKIEQAAKDRAKQASPTEYTKETFKDRRLIVMFFDLQSMQPDEITRGIKSAKKYIDEQMRAADFVSIVSLSNQLNIDQDFTSNKEDLGDALDSFDPNSANGFADNGTPGAAATDDTDTSTDAEFSPDTGETDIFNTDRKFDVLRTIAETLGSIEEKKTLLFFSGGLRANGIDNQTSYRAAVNAAVRSNTAIYTVDTRGLQAVVPGGAANTASGRGANAFNGRGLRGQFTALQASQDTLVSLAADTGGRSLMDTNDFGKIFTQIQEDTAMYYVLGYSSTNPAKDGKYRNIRVNVKVPSVRVDARRGYYADRDFQHLEKENRDKQMQDELAADLPSTDLPVYLSTGYFKLDDARYFVPVSIVVPGSAIPFATQSNQDKATLDILGAVLEPVRTPGGAGGQGGPRGGGGGGGGGRGGQRGGGQGGFRGGGPPAAQQSPRIFGQIKQTIKLNLDAEQEVKRKNVQYDAAFLLPPGRFRLRFIVRENETGQIGSFEADVLIPNLLAAPVKVSSVIASAQKTAGKARKDNPLMRNGTELIPSVTHVFSKDQHLYLFYEVYDPQHPADVDAGNKTAARLLTNATFYKGNNKVYETPLMEVNQINTPERKAATIELDVPLSELKAGFYTCQVNVIDEAAGQVVFPRLALLVR
ncbi:MAG TPA: VWA domain-containing protein [Terriglobia bacterium]|jgi:VWFA-related protein